MEHKAEPPKNIFLFFQAFSFISTCLIIFAVNYPPLVDLPNHMARYALEANFIRGLGINDYYQIKYQLMPNIGMDGIGPILFMLLKPIMAAKVILILSILLFWGGSTFYILQSNAYQAHAYVASLALLPFVFNFSFFMGFINYYSGLGLAFLVLVHFRYYWYKPQLLRRDLILHTILVSILFFWHLADWGIYGVIMLSHIIIDSIKNYRLNLQLKTTLLRAFLGVFPGILTCGLCLVYAFHFYGGQKPKIWWGTWFDKITLLLHQFGVYNPLLDGASILLWMASIYYLMGKKDSTRHATIHYLAISIFFVLSFLLPVVIGGEYGSDCRMWPPIIICMIAQLASFYSKNTKIAIILLFTCLCLRYISIYVSWHHYDKKLTIMTQSFAHFKTDTRVLPIIFSEDEDKEHPYAHFLSWAVIAKQIFIPSLFAYPNDPNPLNYKFNPPWGGNIFLKNQEGWKINEALVTKNYDYIWLVNPQHERYTLSSTHFKLVYSNDDDLYLYRVKNQIKT